MPINYTYKNEYDCRRDGGKLQSTNPKGNGGNNRTCIVLMVMGILILLLLGTIIVMAVLFIPLVGHVNYHEIIIHLQLPCFCFCL